MRQRVIIFLLLFAVSAGILVWVVGAVRRAPERTRFSPWTLTCSDLEHCGHEKHAMALTYDRYADMATTEQNQAAQRLFHALAAADRVGEFRCASAIEHLGGRYTPPGRIVILYGTTQSNLVHSLLKEEEDAAFYSGAIGRALGRGNHYAARVLARAAAADNSHLLLLRQYNDNRETTYRLCPLCGALSESPTYDYCPCCLTVGTLFKEIE